MVTSWCSWIRRTLKRSFEQTTHMFTPCHGWHLLPGHVVERHWLGRNSRSDGAGCKTNPHTCASFTPRHVTFLGSRRGGTKAARCSCDERQPKQVKKLKSHYVLHWRLGVISKLDTILIWVPKKILSKTQSFFDSFNVC